MNNSSPQEHPFTITSLNTQYGNAIASPQATSVLEGSDVVLLQEVQHVDPSVAKKNLGTAGLHLAAFYAPAGLAIAVSDRFTVVREEYFGVQRQGKLAKAAQLVGQQQRFRERGMLLATLKDTVTGEAIIGATAHPIVAVRPFARAKQVGGMTELMSRRYATGAFALGADMNHFPQANKVDQLLARKGRLKPVSNTDPTCLLQDTRHAWLGRFGMPDPRLDTLLLRGLIEVSSEVVDAQSDHKAVRALVYFKPR